MFVQKTICWAAPLGVQYAADAAASTEAGTGSSCSAMTQHYPTTTPLLLYGLADYISLFLICYSFTHTAILLMTCQSIK